MDYKQKQKRRLTYETRRDTAVVWILLNRVKDSVRDDGSGEIHGARTQKRFPVRIREI